MRRVPLMAATLMLALLATTFLPVRGAEEYYPTSGWRTSAPESQGMSSKKLLEMNDYIRANSIPIDGLVVIRHGYLVWETYPNPLFSTTDTHRLYSVTKSFTSCLVGIA